MKEKKKERKKEKKKQIIKNIINKQRMEQSNNEIKETKRKKTNPYETKRNKTKNETDETK